MRTLKVALILILIMSYPLILPMHVMAKQNSQESSFETKQIDTLKEQNRLLTEHNGQLLSVVQWSLGFAALFLLAYLGVNLFVAFRLHKKDTENIKSELTAMVRDLIREEESTLSKAMNERFGDKMQVMDQWKSQVDSSSDKKLQDLQAKVAKSISDVMAKCNASVSEVRDSTISLEYDMLETKANEWKLHSPPILENALRRYIEMLDLACTHSSLDWRISDLLEVMLVTIRGTSKLHADTAADMEEVLGKVPKKYQSIVDNIKHAIRH